MSNDKFDAWATDFSTQARINGATHGSAEQAAYQPSHYSRFVMEPATIAAANGLNGMEMNVLKYMMRAPYKGKELEDLTKAKRCVEMLIETYHRKQRIAAGESPAAVWSVML